MDLVEDSEYTFMTTDGLVTGNKRHGKEVGRSQGIVRCEVENEGFGGKYIEDVLNKANK